MRWFSLSFAVVAEVIATLSLKGALFNPWLYFVVVAGYITAFGALFVCLRYGMPLGVAYGAWAAAGIALTAALSTLIFNEPFTLTMGAGIVLIMFGVLLVELGGGPAGAARLESEESP